MRVVGSNQLRAAQGVYDLSDEWRFQRGTLEAFFRENATNESETIVATKVALIDGLFQTQLWMRSRRPIMVQHLLSMTSRDLDARMQAGDVTVAVEISQLPLGQFEGSFATKFAHFHNVEDFPVLDSRARLALSVLTGQAVRDSVRDFYDKAIKWKEATPCCSNAGWDVLDKYLWLYGQRLNPKWRTAEYRRLENSNDGRTLLSQLDPE